MTKLTVSIDKPDFAEQQNQNTERLSNIRKLTDRRKP